MTSVTANIPSCVPRRWLILSQYYAPEIGAPQIRLRSLVTELGRHGLAVSVLTAMPNYPEGRLFPAYERRWFVREQIDGVPVRRTWIHAATGRSPQARLANYFSFTLTGTLAALFGRRPDVVFVESQPLSIGIAALLMKWLRGVPYVYNVPDLQIEVAEQMGFMSNATVLRAARAFEGLLFRHAWKVSTVTERFVEHIRAQGLPADRVTFLPNGADTRFLVPQAPSERLIDRWNLRGKTVFLYVGTHAYYHGLDTIIDAAALLQSRPDMVFLMVGKGPERARLQAMATGRQLGNVMFVDSPYDERPELYSIARASLATLRDMPVANRMRLAKVFPSLSCGVPVIYAGRGEGADLLVREGCGLAVPPGDPASLAAAAVQLTDDPREAALLGKRGRQLVEARYGWERIVERWLSEIAAPGDEVAVRATLGVADAKRATGETP